VSELPEGWAATTFGELGRYLNGRGFKKSEWSRTGRPIVRIQDLTGTGKGHNYFDGDVAEENLVRDGDLLISWAATIDAFIWRGPEACVNQHIFKVESYIDRRFHYYAARAFANDLRRRTHGGGIVHVTRERFDSTPMFLPPLQEQGRIVAKLEELLSDLDAGVAAVAYARANLGRYRAGVLKAAVEGRLTEKWRAAHPDVEPAEKLLERVLAERRRRWEEAQLKGFAEKKQAPPKGWKDRYSEPVGPDVSLLPALPGGWCWAAVGQVAEVQGGIQKQPNRAPKGNAFPYLRVGNVLRDRLDLLRIEHFELTDEELLRLRLEPGDLLVVEGNGSRNEIGRSALWRGEIENCVHQNHIIRVRFLAGLPEYLNAYWNSPSGMARVAAKSASTSGLYTLSVGKVSELPIPLPPLVEQREIVSEVGKYRSNLERDLVALEAMVVRSDRLRQSILRRAFEGKLVPQDPNDEPASELLARIQAGIGSVGAFGRKGSGGLIRKRTRKKSGK